jgi:hypothetical protein
MALRLETARVLDKMEQQTQVEAVAEDLLVMHVVT